MQAEHRKIRRWDVLWAVYQLGLRYRALARCVPLSHSTIQAPIEQPPVCSSAVICKLCTAELSSAYPCRRREACLREYSAAADRAEEAQQIRLDDNYEDRDAMDRCANAVREASTMEVSLSLGCYASLSLFELLCKLQALPAPLRTDDTLGVVQAIDDVEGLHKLLSSAIGSAAQADGVAGLSLSQGSKTKRPQMASAYAVHRKASLVAAAVPGHCVCTKHGAAAKLA